MTLAIEPTILRIQDTLGMSHEELADRLKFTGKELVQFSKGRKKLPISNLAAFADSLQLSIDNFCDGNIDFVALEKHHLGDVHHVPERYAQIARSRMRSVNIFLKYIEDAYGWTWRRTIMRRFQLTESLVSNLSQQINITFFQDLTGFLRNNGLTESSFFRIGAHSYKTNRSEKSTLISALSEAGSVSDAFDRLCQMMASQIEDNCIYSIRRTGRESVILTCRERQDLAHALGTRHLGNPELCAYKAGFLSQVSRYYGDGECTVQEIRCAHKGDPQCEFLVSSPSDAGRIKPKTADKQNRLFILPRT